MIASDSITLNDESLICDTSNNSVTVRLEIPNKPQSLQIFNYGSNRINLEFKGAKLAGEDLTDTTTFVDGDINSIQLVYANEEVGWLDIQGAITKLFVGDYSPGMSLVLQGSLTDLSGNNNHASALNLSPEIVLGIDNQKVLRWNGSGTQELDIPNFLEGTHGATLYCVFTANNENNFNLIRTKELDDYWRFVNGAGYFGTFLDSRLEQYPFEMPQSGNHLISVHANSNSYEVLLNNQPQGVVDAAYHPGDIFRISTNDKPFKGDIALILVYPFFVDKLSTEHQNNAIRIANKYPSLGINL